MTLMKADGSQDGPRFGDEAPAGRLPIMMPLTEADSIKPRPQLVFARVIQGGRFRDEPVNCPARLQEVRG